ncbi:hypothetical protein [Solemya pervernicosa gill symbiont]|uniref:hypothetical protein n=1 Tax=Solemya pervernicosa gill symbiont TaxID=642797 RepID=UPI00269F9881|nr:hypothetical protein [Solemya pervernicosa gill symbiont]
MPTAPRMKFFIGLRGAEGWIGGKLKLELPCSDGGAIMALCRRVLNEQWLGEGIHQVQVTALDPKPLASQGDLFAAAVPVMQRENTNEVMDAVNDRYGEFNLAPARLLQRSSMPNVIAPAWKPFGHRKTV